MISQKYKECSPRAVIKYTGAFMAWVIGAGFATGQEILQFFSSYGYASYGVVILNLAGFLILSEIIITTGYDHKSKAQFNHFVYFCGNKLGALYTSLIPVTLALIMSVLISGAGTTLYEYYGINRYVGSALMSALILCSYLVGFEKMVKIVSMISPIIIVFTLLVGTITVIRDIGNISEITKYEPILISTKASPNWILSAALYLSLNFLGGSTYYTALGAKAESRNSARLGALFGTMALIASIAIMNTAILLNSENTSTLAIPTLYLATKISYVIGAAFSIILLLGIFSSCSTMMWTVCGRFFNKDIKKNRMFAVIVSIGTFIMSLFPFTKLVSVFYPLVGYMGLLFVGCVIFKRIEAYKRGTI
ncbi:MAG: hypothetical protein ABFD04_03595 [Syntrophomonas sp.]